MRHFLFYTLLLFSFTNCTSQDSKLLSNTPTDFSSDPFYYDITEEKNGEIVWEERFSFLDSLNISNITYKSDDLKVTGFLITPKKEGKYPVIIFNRGGNRDFGAVSISFVLSFLSPLANEGYVILASNYRGNGGSEGQEEFGGADVNDIINLIDVVDEIENADSEKIGLYGWSRGGMMTYQALTKTDRIKTAVVGGAVSDMWLNIKNRPSMETSVFAELIPNYYENKEAELTKRSAIKWADKFPKNVPILMLHGNADWRVKSEHSLKMALEFEKYRIPYRLIMLEGGDHGITEHRKEVKEQVIKWFDTYLKKETPLPNMEYHGR